MLSKKTKATLGLCLGFLYVITLLYVFNPSTSLMFNYQNSFIGFEITDIKEYEVDIEDVLGAEFFAGGRGRCNPSSAIPLQLFCGAAPPGSVDEREIYGPDKFFTGATSPFDNLVQVNNPTGAVAYRNAAQTIDPENDYLINMPPLPGHEEKVAYGSAISKEPFAMHWGFTPASGPLYDTQDLYFDSFDRSICPAVNTGEFNVTATNILQEDLTLTVTPPALMEFPDRSYVPRICRSERAKHIDLNSGLMLCPSTTITCPCPFGCTYSAATLFVDAPLGSGEICYGSDCGIRYWEAAGILSSPPTWTDDMYPSWLSEEQKENDYIIDDPMIITTSCKARIGCTIYTGRCRWDISAWQHIYDLEQRFTYPGYEYTKEKDEYWRGVAREIGGNYR